MSGTQLVDWGLAQRIAIGLAGHPHWLWGLVLVGPLALIGLYDLVQTHHSLRRTYPITARVRWFFEWLRPFLRAYIVESDLEGRPFSHDERALVYARAHAAEDAHPFGTELDVYSGEYEWLAHSMVPRQAAPAKAVAITRSSMSWPGAAACSTAPSKAKPSMAELSCGGTLKGEMMSCASTRSSASNSAASSCCATTAG